jgi:hypothetical protein
MFPTPYWIDQRERTERQRDAWEPEALHIPAPPARRPDDRAHEQAPEEKAGGSVIIIDLSDFSEISL